MHNDSVTVSDIANAAPSQRSAKPITDKLHLLHNIPWLHTSVGQLVFCVSTTPDPHESNNQTIQQHLHDEVSTSMLKPKPQKLQKLQQQCAAMMFQ
jgi:hypothetical protein